jgi:NADH-quinone oxidoreductase subunit L
MMAPWLVLLAIAVPWAGGAAVWLVGDGRPRAQHALACAFAAIGGLISLALLTVASSLPAVVLPVGGVFGDLTLIPNGLAVFLTAVAEVVGCLAVIFSVDYMHGEEQLGRYYALVLFFIGAMAGLVLSGSLLFMFFFWEITAFCSYALISFHNDNPAAVAGGVKALVMTQLGGIGLLAGALFAYVSFGTYEIDVFIARAAELAPAALAVVSFGFLIAAAAKSAQVPFHTWLPDAMEAPSPVTALIHAATMVNAGVYLLARFYPAFAGVPAWSTAVIVVGLLSALLAGWMALVADDLKRSLAYSTISQLGVMVYAVGVGAVFASQFHLLSHALFKALLFLAGGAVIHAVGTRDLKRMGGLGRTMPFVRTAFVIGVLGLAAIPIANGFFSKELVLEGGLAGGPSWAAFGLLLGGGLTALYGLRLVDLAFGGALRGEGGHDAGKAMRVSLSLLALGTLTSWVLAGPLSQLIASTMPSQHLEPQTTVEIVVEVVRAPATWLALVVVALGLALWRWRAALGGLSAALRRPAEWGRRGLGFEWMNTQVARAAVGSAEGLRRTQTGQLAWNVAGGLIGLLVLVLAVSVWG